MKESSKKCYFAYTWEDDELQLPKLLEYLKDRIETYTEGEIEVTYDRQSFKTGDDFEKKEEDILLNDCIVIFFSPNYKKIVDEKDENRGVYREYKKIKKVKENGVAAIVPVIIEGDEKSAITEEFKKNIAAIFKVNDVFTKGQKKIKQRYFGQIEQIVGKIIKETNLAYKKRDYSFSSKDDMMELLFGESKANQKLPQKCMYKTDAYINVINQHRRYIIGRKGSGKSTFLELLEKYDVIAFEENFKVLKPIAAEKINIEHAYTVINSFKCDDVLFPLDIRIEMFWEIYTYICAIYIVCLEEELFKVEDNRKDIFKKSGDIFRNEKFMIEKLEDAKCHEALFVSAIGTFEVFFRSYLVEYSNIKSYDASLVANFNVDNVMKFYFGQELYYKLKNAILKCKKNIIIALDGFDRLSERFRVKTISYLNSSNENTQQLGKNRLEFESLFYRSMFNVFERLKETNRGIMNKVSFCIIIPQDKLDQIKTQDRDFSKYNFASLSWDAVDLLQMLICRLEYVYGYVECDDIVEKFEKIMKKNFHTIPLTIKIKIDDYEHDIDLFEYLLRISFWRPRDILKYFYELYLANKNNVKRRDELSSSTVKSILYSKASDIIEEEFYFEYRTVIRNIEDIMEKFRGKNIVLDVEEVYEILTRQVFQTSAIREFNNPFNKLKMLYELSVMGIMVDRNVMVIENLNC